MKLLFSIIFSALSLISMAKPGGSKTKPGDSTFIYIYRSGQFTGSLSNWWIFVDEQKICKLSNNRYMQVYVKPGKHNISAKLSGAAVFKKETEIDIDTEKDKNYFIACNVKMSVLKARLELLEVTESTGAKQMDGMLLDNCQQPSQ